MSVKFREGALLSLHQHRRLTSQLSHNARDATIIYCQLCWSFIWRFARFNETAASWPPPVFTIYTSESINLAADDISRGAKGDVPHNFIELNVTAEGRNTQITDTRPCNSYDTWHGPTEIQLRHRTYFTEETRKLYTFLGKHERSESTFFTACRS